MQGFLHLRKFFIAELQHSHSGFLVLFLFLSVLRKSREGVTKTEIEAEQELISFIPVLTHEAPAGRSLHIR